MAAITAVLALLSAAAVRFFYSQGSILYYGDAMAHLNIARRIIDTRTPNWLQIGTVWLPLPHLLMLPLVRSDELWRSGLAGSIPSAVCYVLGGVLMFLAARRMFASGAAGMAACLLFALNPNLLYLQAIPMTESLFLMCFAGVLYTTVRFRESQSSAWAAAAGVFALAATLTRYEGWFLLPFVAAYLFIAAQRQRWLPALIFSIIAGAGPLWWFAHNWWYYGHFLEFYNGPYSAKAIYQRALDGGMARYPGDHDWLKATQYFSAAVSLAAGATLVWIGAIGVIAAFIRKAFWPVLFAALVPAFYVFSLYSSGTPIFVPHLWPNSYYNTRYAIGALPLLALGGAGLVALAPQRFRGFVAALIVAIGIAPWAFYPRPDSWVCWKESQVNSVARRAWTSTAAKYLAPRYAQHDGIFTAFGDLAGIYLEAGIPLKECLHDGNVPHWDAAVKRPDLFLWEEWVVAISGDPADTALARMRQSGPRYDLVETIAVKGAPVIKIYRRNG
ncbi:MAG TPA: glycosyltransferase family 39 protein [Bryobacteraceae bacterium]|nr:glycosyltransferase family 39 protein [Bryobacteraceae bacterium]